MRQATPSDEAAIARICLLTGADGGDATGMFADDRALADVYAVPYLFGPDCVALAWDIDGEVRGYVLGAVDTLAFQRWFARDWWPTLPARTPRTRDDEWLLPSAADPSRLVSPVLASYPAHLHIDLLPDQQGRGAGRQLIDAFCSVVADAGAPGVHLVASASNPFAQGFYPRVGFRELARTATTVTFAREL